MTSAEQLRELRAQHNAPIMDAVRLLLAELIEDENRQALLPNLASETRHYQAGRAAALINFRDELDERSAPVAP